MTSPPPLSRNRDFVLLWTGQALSTLGSRVSTMAFPLLVLALTGSPGKAGIVGFAAAVPYPLFVLPAGVLVDRWNRRRVMIACDAGRAFALAALAVALAAGHVSYLLVAAVAFVDGTLFAFFNIAETGVVGQVVPAVQLPEAMARDSARYSAAWLVGPSVGGVLFGISRLLPFVVDAISYAFSVATLLAMRTPFQQERLEPRERLRVEVVQGFVWLWRHSFLRTCALIFAVGNFVGGALFLAVVVVARRDGLAPSQIGVLVAALGALGLAGSLVAPTLLRRLSLRTIVAGYEWLGVGLVAFLVAPNAYVLAATYAPYFFFTPTLNSAIIGYRIAIVPDRLQGRVNSVARFLANVAAPLGPLAAGVLLETVSERATIAVFAGLLTALATYATVSASVRDAPSLDELATETGRAPVA